MSQNRGGIEAIADPGSGLILVYHDIEPPVQCGLHPHWARATVLKRVADSAVVSRS